jgi:hypothetical protein
MNVKSVILFVYVAFIQQHLLAQGANSTIYPAVNNGWQLTLSPTLSSKSTIKSNYLNTSELNVYSKAIWGFNGQIARHLSINDKSFFSIGGSFGFYRADIGYDLSRPLFDTTRLKNSLTFDHDKFGLTLHFSTSVNYNLRIWGTNRTSIFAKIGLGLNYMMASFYGYGDSSQNITAIGVFNENRKPFLSGLVGISLRQQISKRLYFVSGLTYAYSPTTTYEGTYNIYTKSNILTGNIEKKFSQLNFDIGLFRSLTPTPYVSKRGLNYENDDEMPDFYGKGWGLSFASYWVSKFKVNQKPASASTTFYSKSRLSYKGELTKLTPLSKKTFLKASFAFGNFPLDDGVRIEQNESITGESIDIYEKYDEGLRYGALSLQYGRILLSDVNQALTFSVGGSVNRITPSGWGDSRTELDAKDRRSKKIYEVEGDDYGNPDSESLPFLSGKIDISYWAKINDNFSLYLTPFIDVSNKDILVGGYKIFGKNTVYEGRIHKKFQQFGISAGVFWMLPRKIRIEK